MAYFMLKNGPLTTINFSGGVIFAFFYTFAVNNEILT